MSSLTQKAKELLVNKHLWPRLDPPTRWVVAWGELAVMTEGIPEKAPLFHQILRVLEQCDQAFEQGKWEEFSNAYHVIQNLVETNNTITSSKSQRKDRANP